MPKKDSPVRSKKFDHPKDMAPGYRKLDEPQAPKHPKKSPQQPPEKGEVKT